MQQTNQDAQKFSQGRIDILMQATKNMTKKQMKKNQIEDLFHDDVIAKKKEAMTEFSAMFEQSLQDRDYKVGDIVKGKIVEVQTDYVLVDINYKSEGLIPINEFRFVEGKLSVQPGDEVEVFIDKIENENGMIVLSKDKADMYKAWNDITRAAENQELIEGTVIAKVKGGLSVDIGVKAFLPGSQIDLRPVRNMDVYIGKKYKFKVIKFNKKRGNIVLSRRALLEEERESMKTQTMDAMKEGSVIRGMVKNITEYGAFLDLGGMDGLLHITDMSWGRIKHPSEVLNVGDEIEVMVLKYDQEKERVSLGLKQLQRDPWLDTAEKYSKGSQVTGKVTSLVDYGAFVEIGEGVEGLIHVSEMSWTKKVKHPSQALNVGDEVRAMVLDIDQENRRISLGLKQLETNPWLELKETYQPGTIIEGEVKSITDFGVFVGVEDGIDGLVHVSDFSWAKRVNHPSEMFTKGQKVRAVVLGVDVENERFSLGVKQLEADPWQDVERRFLIGSTHEVKVVRLADFGAFVELSPEAEGLIHISELSSQRIGSPGEVVNVGDQVRAEVISIDQEARKVGLSVRLAKLREENGNVSEYVAKSTSSKSSLGDVFGDKLKELRNNQD
jgi:small subunit ribosomal protein S1